jgi:uncharacterized OsmC-like protein
MDRAGDPHPARTTTIRQPRLEESFMEGAERIGSAFERNARALELRPSVGQGTAVTRVRVTEGLTCEVEDGPWKLVVDMGEKSGGLNRGPNPGVLGRAALGSCLAVGYVMWAARRGVPISSLEVEVQADYDARGYHGIGGVEPGYEQIRYVVTVESEASEDEIARLLDEADRNSDYLAVFQRPQEVVRRLHVSAPGR